MDTTLPTTMTNRCDALVLLAHGARDPLWAAPFERLREAVVRQLGTPLPVQLAFLEFMVPSLEDAAAGLAEVGCRRIQIVPVFLGVGGHVRRDVPEVLARLATRYPRCEFSLMAALGESDAVIDAMARVCVDGQRAPNAAPS